MIGNRVYTTSLFMMAGCAAAFGWLAQPPRLGWMYLCTVLILLDAIVIGLFWVAGRQLEATLGALEAPNSSGRS
jgi:hypothetical protein